MFRFCIFFKSSFDLLLKLNEIDLLLLILLALVLLLLLLLLLLLEVDFVDDAVDESFISLSTCSVAVGENLTLLYFV